MPRTPIPPVLEQYLEWRKNGPPKFCHNCIQYDKDGVCLLFGAEPPEEFTQKQGECLEWEEDVPF